MGFAENNCVKQRVGCCCIATLVPENYRECCVRARVRRVIGTHKTFNDALNSDALSNSAAPRSACAYRLRVIPEKGIACVAGERGPGVAEFLERIKTTVSRDFWEADHDWMMLAICAALLVGWALWLGAIAYRLLVP
jgi:hypothetical protein